MDITNYNILKRLSKKELLALVPEDFSFKTEPWTQQIAAFLGCIINGGFLSALDLGTGKSKVAIDACRYYEIERVLVVCMNSAVEKWADEVEMHSDFSATCLRGDSKIKWSNLRGKGFFMVNYEGLRFWLCKKEEKKKGEGYKLVLDFKKVKRLLDFELDAIIVDESHLIRNIKSLNYKIISTLAKNIEIRLLLTGTPFGQSLLEIWPQYFVTDKGETFGKNFYRFRAMNFKDVGFLGPEYEVTKNGFKEIKKKLWRRAIRYREDEVDDLPAKVYNTIEYDLSLNQQMLYDKVIDGEIESIRNSSMILRQICGGTLSALSQTKLEIDFWNFNKNPKLEALGDLIDSVIESNKIVIFYEFENERVIITELLMEKYFNKSERAFSIATLAGVTKDPADSLRRFKEDSNCRIMLAHPKSGGASIDLISANYCLIYSMGYSVIERKQLEKRIHRGGQVKRCFYYDFLANDSIEISLYKDLRAGKDFFKKVIDEDIFKKAAKGEM